MHMLITKTIRVFIVVHLYSGVTNGGFRIPHEESTSCKITLILFHFYYEFLFATLPLHMINDHI